MIIPSRIACFRRALRTTPSAVDTISSLITSALDSEISLIEKSELPVALLSRLVSRIGEDGTNGLDKADNAVSRFFTARFVSAINIFGVFDTGFNALATKAFSFACASAEILRDVRTDDL
jgi:hypothetical protein